MKTRDVFGPSAVKVIRQIVGEELEFILRGGEPLAVPAAGLVAVTVKLRPEDRDALQEEALRRRVGGEARRIDASAIIRSLISEWRATAGAGGRR